MLDIPKNNCLICGDTALTDLLKCGSPFCVNCATQWVACQIQEHFLVGESLIKCPNENCTAKHEIKSILTKLPHKEHQHLSNLMFKNYIQETSDVINCQNGTCKYYGIIPPEKCPEDLVCELCGHRWKEKSQLNFYEKAVYYLGNLHLVVNELQTLVYEFFFTVQCPRCTIPIRKAGGCNHMTCKKCSHEFCWVCKQDFNQHANTICAANTLAGLLVIGYFLFHVGFLLGIYYTIWNLLVNGLKLFLKMCFFNLTFLIIFLLIFPIICLCKERESIFENKSKLIWYLICFSVMSYIAWWDVVYLINHYGNEFLWATCIEVVLIWTIWTVDFIVQTWLKYVL